MICLIFTCDRCISKKAKVKGGRKMGKSDRIKRTKAASAAFQESLIDQRAEEQLQGKSNDDLFAVDTVAKPDRKKRKRDPPVQLKPEAKDKNKALPKVRLFVVLSYRMSTKIILPEYLLSQFKENPKKAVAVEDLSDLWGSVQGKEEKKKACARLTPVHAKLPASHPGTSYNPQVEDHQDIIAEAVAVELRRAEASQMKDPLWAEARKKSNQSFDDNIEEDSESDSEVTNFKVKKTRFIPQS
jgi:hypothetical protein